MADAKDGEASEAAERYAQAAFELGQDQNALEALDADFAKISAALKESADLKTAAFSPLIDPATKARAFVAVAEKLGISPLGRNVIGVVAQNGRAAELAAVAKSFRAKHARHRGAQRAEIISATKLSDAEAQSIVDAVSKKWGRKIEADTSVDESLIGGFIVRVGSRQFDASLKSKLAGLKLALKSA